jgi:hypothetical protein
LLLCSVSTANLWTNQTHTCNVRMKTLVARCAPEGSTYSELPKFKIILLVPKPNINNHPEFSFNWQNVKCMLLQEQSCDVPAFTYCTVVFPSRH